MRRILHVDMDAFFAAVEVKKSPELKGKPLVVGGRGDPTKRGVVSTASYEARKFGIHSAMPLRTAYKLCPDAQFLPVDFAAYSKESAKIKKILKQFSDRTEDVGIDEAFLDISENKESSEWIGLEIKKKIQEETGLTCSVGIAPNKLLAKIASDMEKPDGLTIITQDDIGRRIWPLPVRKLWGVGPKTDQVLDKCGVQTIAELAAQPLPALTERFGPSFGNYLYQASRGIDESPIVTHWEPKSTGRETTFEHDLRRWQEIAAALAELTREVANDLRSQDYLGQTVTLKLRFSDFETHTRAKTLPAPTGSEQEIRKAAFDCLSRLDLKKKVRLLGVRVSRLQKNPQ